MSQISEIKVFYANKFNTNIKITDSKQAYDLAMDNWDLDVIEFQEIVKAIYLNRGNKVLGIFEVSKGGISGSIVDVRIILSVALKSNASGIILIHNHPSGNLNPSSSDIDLTLKIKEACKLLDYNFLDHLIISKENYYSFKDEGSVLHD
jgi:DNA repair protein RadC